MDIMKKLIRSGKRYVTSRVVCKGLIMFFIIFLSLFKTDCLKAYAYTDSNLYEENLVFDIAGNLVMSTHDKKATSGIRYKTVGWVIKRYDMPMAANGQQYVIIPMDENVDHWDDPNDNAYVYCCYYGNKNTISSAIERRSAEWKNLLYKYGDYVYIDEIMTVVEYGKVLGGLNADGSSYGEVYYDFNGISRARPWASKESLRTHFDKRVYFPQQITEKKFGHEYIIMDSFNINNEPEFKIQLGSGNKYEAKYDIQSGVPTGTPLYISGSAQQYKYSIDFDRISVLLKIPIKLVIHYTIEWKAYDGSIVTEEKDIVSWYHVNRWGTYYIVKNMDIDYLSDLRINNYAFDSNVWSKKINGTAPRIKHITYKDYYEHVTSPEYKDVYYINGGKISDLSRPGIKPSVPDVDRQSVVESFVGQCKVVNDYLDIDNIVIMNNDKCIKHTQLPKKDIYLGVRQLYYSNIIIPDTKRNCSNNVSSGFICYTDYKDKSKTKYKLKGLKNISIHTPVCISGKTEGSYDDFSIITDLKGQHKDIKGYGLNDYSGMCKKVCVKFTEDVYKNGEKILKDSWTEVKEDDRFSIDENLVSENIKVIMLAYARNHIALYDDIEEHVEDKANLELDNYAARTEFYITFNDTEKDNIKKVVGTH